MVQRDIEVRIFDTPDKLAETLAGMIARLPKDGKKVPVHIALSGGKTPEVLFETLACKFREKTEWDLFHFWWCDERCVDLESPESNFGEASRQLFSKVPVPAPHLHRIAGEAHPEEEAERYSREIKQHLPLHNQWPVFDLVLLGMGDDGHIASLFPGHLDLMNSPRICEVVSHPQTGQKRITLTGRVINQAHRIVIMVTGETKSHRISEIMNNRKTAHQLPAYYVNPVKGKLEWYLDVKAASLI